MRKKRRAQQYSLFSNPSMAHSLFDSDRSHMQLNGTYNSFLPYNSLVLISFRSHSIKISLWFLLTYMEVKNVTRTSIVIQIKPYPGYGFFFRFCFNLYLDAVTFPTRLFCNIHLVETRFPHSTRSNATRFRLHLITFQRSKCFTYDASKYVALLCFRRKIDTFCTKNVHGQSFKFYWILIFTVKYTSTSSYCFIFTEPPKCVAN